jgi:putative endonuclease
MSFFYTYILKSDSDGKFYTGCTNDPRKRLRQHQLKSVFSTADRLPICLVYYESCNNQQGAFTREKYLKTGMGKRYVKNRLKRFLSLTA